MKFNTESKILFWSHLILALFLTWQLFDLITLLNDTSSKYAFLPNELNNAAFYESTPALIPKIIHQTYKTDAIPEEWKEGQRRCKELNPDYEYILWTDKMAHDFIKREYPWFLTNFENYPYPIQRADAIRYFILDFYGGIYLDLDVGCSRSLDPLLTAPAFVRKTVPTGISNDVMGSVPKHPFFSKTINSLKKYQNNWIVPYITIMYSTGPLFLSVIWKQYIRWGNPESGIVKIIMPNDYKSGPDAFFKISKGSSWHQGDASYLVLMSKHIPLTVFAGFIVFFIIIGVEYSLVYLINTIFGAKIARTWKIITGKFNDLFVSIRTILTGYKPVVQNEDKRKKIQNKVRKSRKDSNLPTRSMLADLEKNVDIHDQIGEE